MSETKESPTPTIRPKKSEDHSEPETIPTSMTCSVCMDILFRPTMFSCGHTVCEPCGDSIRACPVCRYQSDEQRIPNWNLRELIEQRFPKETRSREAKHEKDKIVWEKFGEWVVCSRYQFLLSKLWDHFGGSFVTSIPRLISRFHGKFKFLVSEVECVIARIITRAPGEFRILGKWIFYLPLCRVSSDITDWMQAKPSAHRLQLAYLACIQGGPPFATGTDEDVECYVEDLKFDLGKAPRAIADPSMNAPLWINDIPDLTVLPSALTQKTSRYYPEYLEFQKRTTHHTDTDTSSNDDDASVIEDLLDL